MARIFGNRPKQRNDLKDKVDVAKAYLLSPFDESRDPKYKDNVARRRRVVVRFVLPEGKKFCFNEAKGKVPAYWHARVGGINMHLRDGLAPGREIVGLIEVSVRKTQPDGRDGFVSREYFAVNLYPADGPATHVLRLGPEGAGATTVEVEERTAFFRNESGTIRIVPAGSVDFDGEDDTIVPTGDEPLILGGER